VADENYRITQLQETLSSIIAMVTSYVPSFWSCRQASEYSLVGIRFFVHRKRATFFFMLLLLLLLLPDDEDIDIID
jgi:hypothetical protein